jgi:two-component system LytT family response regulator
MSEKSSIKALIIDDSKQARKLLRLMLIELANDFQVIGEAEDAEKGLRLIKNEHPDVAFLDIEMPGKSGIQLAEQISQLQLKTKIVFTTAYNEYAIKAFRLSAVDYLLKPIQENQLIEATEK